jgi:hypothetical protein
VDADTIKAVREAPLAAWIVVAIVVGGLALVVVLRPEMIPEPYPNTRGWITLAAYILLPIVLLWSLYKVASAIWLALQTPL